MVDTTRALSLEEKHLLRSLLTVETAQNRHFEKRNDRYDIKKIECIYELWFDFGLDGIDFS